MASCVRGPPNRSAVEKASRKPTPPMTIQRTRWWVARRPAGARCERTSDRRRGDQAVVAVIPEVEDPAASGFGVQVEEEGLTADVEPVDGLGLGQRRRSARTLDQRVRPPVGNRLPTDPE